MLPDKDKILFKIGDIEIHASKVTPEIKEVIIKLLDDMMEKKEDIESLKEEKYKKIDKELEKNEMEEYKRKIPSANEILRYIVSKGDSKHTFIELQMHYLGFILDLGKESQKQIYSLFYSRLYRAHKNIRGKNYENGYFEKETEGLPDGTKYDIWNFVPIENADVRILRKIRKEERGEKQEVKITEEK